MACQVIPKSRSSPTESFLLLLTLSRQDSLYGEVQGKGWSHACLMSHDFVVAIMTVIKKKKKNQHMVQ